MSTRIAAAVLIPEGATLATRTAGRELRDALVRAGAAELPLVAAGDGRGRSPAFVVGTPPPGETDPQAADACCVRRKADRLYLWGQGPRGALNAVYAYLQDVLGFRWLTAAVEIVPPLEQPAGLPPELDVWQQPAFALRDVGYREAMQVPWSARLRLNGEFCARGRGPAWGGGMRYTHFVHTFYDLVPPARYFDSHPEYFALVDGRRREALAQLCLTNPDIVGIAAAAVREWFRLEPEASIASVSQNDWLGACECDRCRAVVAREGSQVGPVLHFANAVAREVARTHPDRLIDTLAYWYTEDPPRQLRPEPNVAVRLCHMSPSCESHPVAGCARNAPFAARLEAWARIAPRLHIWDYHTNFAHLLMPFPNFAAIADDLALFRRRGVESVFCQGDLEEGGGGEWAELRAYYLARLLWDTALEPETLVDEFLRGVFPHAHGPVRSYFDGIQARAADPERHLRMFSPVQAGHLPPEVLAGAMASVAAAQSVAKAGGDRAEEEEVGRLRLSLDYVRLAMPPAFVLKEDRLWPETSAPGPGVIDPRARRAALADFVAALGRYGVRRLHEGAPLEDFLRRVGTLSTPHDAPLWRAGDWVLRVVPDLGGRLWEASFAGRQLLAAADMEDADYPASRGYEEGCVGDLGRTEAHMAAAGPDGASLVLTATLAGMAHWQAYTAIAVRRELLPEASDTLLLRTTVTNRDSAPHALAIRPRLCLRGPLRGLAWCQANRSWQEAGSGGPGVVAPPGTAGWRVQTGDVVLECVYGPIDRLDIGQHPWGWRVEARGAQSLVPPGGTLMLEQRWHARLVPASSA